MPATKPALGRLEKVELREYWMREDTDFTPWLALDENLALLGETLGMELALDDTEVGVGPFRADILAKDTVTGAYVLVENQLERTDHSHLGQLLTYAAGLEAVTIVWVAQRFTDEHRAALDWLNRVTSEEISFFGIEVELWRIGDSTPAPKFNVVCKPNDWARTVSRVASTPGGLSDTQQLQIDYWASFGEYLVANGSRLKPPKPRPDNWVDWGRFGRSEVTVGAYINTVAKRQSVNICVRGSNAKEFFAQLAAQRAEIETVIGAPLRWQTEEKKTWCAWLRRSDVDPVNRANWPSMHEWHLRSIEALEAAFGDRVKALVVGGAQGAEDAA